MSDENVPDPDLSKSLSMLFATPFVVHDWPDSDALNRALSAFVLAQEEALREQGIVRSNAGGWQSPGNIMESPEPSIHTLRTRIEKLVIKLIADISRDKNTKRTFKIFVDGWANINRDGDYNILHAHPNCMWSGVYYVQPGKPDPSVPYSGLLELIDPNAAANYVQVRHTIFDAKHFIDNIPGRMLLWPSWVKHMVHPFVGQGDRISIAYNVNLVEENEAPR